MSKALLLYNKGNSNLWWSNHEDNKIIMIATNTDNETDGRAKEMMRIRILLNRRHQSQREIEIIKQRIR